MNSAHDGESTPFSLLSLGKRRWWGGALSITALVGSLFGSACISDPKSKKSSDAQRDDDEEDASDIDPGGGDGADPSAGDGDDDASSEPGSPARDGGVDAASSATTLGSTSTPAPVPGLSGVKSLAIGDYFSCAVVEDGTVMCWGDNGDGQLGNGTTTKSSTPVKVSDLDEVVSIASGLQRSCALRKDGSVWCWGYQVDGHHANGETYEFESLKPTRVSNVSSAIGLVLGATMCALLPEQAWTCWSAPLTPGMPSTTRILALSTANDHYCQVLTDGTVQCSGQPEGISGVPGTTTKPVVVPNLSGVTAISGGLDLINNTNMTCALLQDKTVTCWLGGAAAAKPATVSGLSNVTSVVQAGNEACVLVESGTVSCWGDNSRGQLGSNVAPKQTRSGTPVEIAGLKNVQAIAVAQLHVCALIVDGTVQCWGDNKYGQLGR